MSFDWSSYLTLAKELNESEESHSSGEAYRRSAVSRAYYYAYHLSKSHIESVGMDIPKRNPHASLIALLGEHFDQEGLQLAHRLARMRDYRNQADYDSSFTYNREWVSAMIAQAEQFVKDVVRLPLPLR